MISVAAVREHERPGPTFAATVEELRQLTAGDLADVHAAILAGMRSQARLIPDLAGHLVRAGGKRLRPMLTLASARMFGAEGDRHVKLAAAVELIHGATLLHDDVVDASTLRRGVETANVVWGNKESVLVGDFIFAHAFELMVAAGDLRVLKILSSASRTIAEGEVLQLSTQNNLATRYETYLSVIEAKTAALFAAATECGAVIAGCGVEDIELMRRFGMSLGIAYQLVDDALDYCGAEGALGKTVGDDFREGKMTAPVVFALDRASADEEIFWRRAIADGRQEPEDFGRAREILTRRGAIDETLACARGFAEDAVAALDAAAVRASSAQFTDCLRNLAIASTVRAS